MDILRVELLAHCGEPGHVRKEHGHELAFTLDGAAGRKDFIHQELGGVGAWCLVVDGHGFFGLAKIVAAFEAELTVRRYGIAAFGAGEFEFSPALLAEQRAFGKLCSAVWTNHVLLRPWCTLNRGSIMCVLSALCS